MIDLTIAIVFIGLAFIAGVTVSYFASSQMFYKQMLRAWQRDPEVYKRLIDVVSDIKKGI